MALKFNGTTPTKIVYNGTTLTKVIYNGTTVWQSQVWCTVSEGYDTGSVDFTSTACPNNGTAHNYSRVDESIRHWCEHSSCGKGKVYLGDDYSYCYTCDITWGDTSYDSADASHWYTPS